MRKKHLINYSLKRYIMASVLSMVISTFNNIADGFLMGKLLGPEALSAINLTLPVNYAIASVQCLMAAGAAILISKKRGEREHEEADKIFTVSVISVAAAGVLFFAASLFFTDPIARLCCTESSLLELARDYIRIEMMFAVTIMYQIALSGYAQKTGNPQIVLKANALSMITNIVMDIVYVKALGLGTNGAALATVTGAVVSCVVLMTYFLKKDRPLHFRRAGRESLKIFAGNVNSGMTGAVQTFSMSLLTFILNYFIQKALGANGVFVLSVGLIFLTFTMFFVMGVQGVLTSMGSMLAGQGDDTGLKILMRQCLIYSMPVTCALTMVQIAFPETISRLFGAKSPEAIEMSVYGLRVIALYAIPIALLLLLAALYQVEGYYRLATFLSVSMLALLPVCLWIASVALPREQIWVALPASGVLTFLLLLIVSLIYRAKSKEPLEIVTLFKKRDDKTKVFEGTITVSDGQFKEFMEQTIPFFEQLTADSELGLKIRLCVEEMIAFVVSQEPAPPKYMDVRISASENRICAMIKDNCPEYNPTIGIQDNMSMKLVRAFCPEVEYMYSFGQNMTFLSWNITS